MVMTLPGAFQFPLMRKGWYICRSKHRNYHRVGVVTDYSMSSYNFLQRCAFILRPLGAKENPLMNCYGTFQPTRPPGTRETPITPLKTIKTTSTTRPTTPPTTHRPEGKMKCNNINCVILSQDSPKQTDLARLIRCLLYGKTRTISLF